MERKKAAFPPEEFWHQVRYPALLPSLKTSFILSHRKQRVYSDMKWQVCMCDVTVLHRLLSIKKIQHFVKRQACDMWGKPLSIFLKILSNFGIWPAFLLHLPSASTHLSETLSVSSLEGALLDSSRWRKFSQQVWSSLLSPRLWYRLVQLIQLRFQPPPLHYHIL